MKTKLLVICTLLLFMAGGAFAKGEKPIEIKAIPIDAVPQRVSGANLDAAPLNGYCDVGNTAAVYWIDDWLIGDESYKVFVDPTSCGCFWPDKVLPVSVNMFVFAEAGIELCGPIVMQADIEAVEWTPGCPVPSDNVLCQSPAYNVSFPGSDAYIVSLPLEPCAGLTGPFFISVTFPDLVCPQLNVVIDDAPEICNSFNDWGAGWYDLVHDGGFPGKISMYATVDCLSALEATIDFDPNTLNLKSKGKYVTCYIELPAGYDPADIDVSTVMLNGVVPAEMRPTTVGDYDMDGIPDRMVKFSRGDLISVLGSTFGESVRLTERGEASQLSHGDMVEMTVTGELLDGTGFRGSDEIRVINPGGGPNHTDTDEAAVFEVYPTPVAGTARISFELDVAGPVSLRVFDVAGRMVRTLESGYKDAGRYDVTWDRKTDDGQTVGPGVYFIRLDRSSGAKMQKLLVVE